MTQRLTDAQLATIRQRAESATEEIWLPIDGTNGMYEVSNLGNVRSKLKPGNHRNKLGASRLLKLRGDGRGYLSVSLPLRKDGQYATKTVHSLVMQAFAGQRPEGLEIAHLNGNPSDNSFTNLKYVTHSENEQHKRQHGTAPVGEKNGQSKLQGWQVEIIKYLLSKGVPQARLKDLFECSSSVISAISIGDTWGHIQPHKDIPLLLAEIERLKHDNKLLREIARSVLMKSAGIESDEELDDLLSQLIAEEKYRKKGTSL